MVSRSRCSLALAALLVIAAQVPAAASDLSERIEKLLGDYVRLIIESSLPLEHNRLLTGIVEGIGGDVVRVGGRPSVRHSFRLLDVEDVNALAAPGGRIWITKGALRYVESIDELAGIVGHETAHVTCRHGWEAFKQDVAYTVALAALPASAGSFAAWADGLYFVAGMKMSRDDEFEADRRGAEFSAVAGYDIREIARFFERIEKDHGGGLDRLDVIFSTHPATADRIARIAQLGAAGDSAPSLLQRGDGYLSRRLFASALEAYRMASGSRELAREAEVRAAVAAAFLGRTDEAQAHLTRAGELLDARSLIMRDDAARAYSVVADLAARPRKASLTVVSAAEANQALVALRKTEEKLSSLGLELEAERAALREVRNEVARGLRALARAMDAYDRLLAGGLASSPRRATPLRSDARSVVASLRAAAVASGAGVDEIARTVKGRLELARALRRAIESEPDRVAQATVAIAGRCADGSDQLARTAARACELTRQSLAALQEAILQLGARPEAARAVMSGTGLAIAPGAAALGQAARLQSEARGELGRPTLETALMEVSLYGQLLPVPAEVLDDALGHALRLDRSAFAEARLFSSDPGTRLLIVAAAADAGCGLAAAARALLGAQERSPALRSLGADEDALGIACRLAAQTLRREWEAWLRIARPTMGDATG